MRQCRVVSTPSANEVPALRALVLSLANYYLAPEQTQIPAWLQATFTEEAFYSRLNDMRYYHRVLFVDGELAGYIAFHTAEGAAYHLYHLFVDARFQRQSVATQLWQHAKNELEFASCRLRSSLYAVPVYEQFGFIKSGAVQEKDGLLFQSMLYNANAIS